MKFVVNSRNAPMDIMYLLNSKASNNTLHTTVTDALNGDLILERKDRMNNGKKEVILKLPSTPEKMLIETKSIGSNRNFRSGSNFKVENAKVVPLRKWKVDLGSGDKEFVDFIKKFCRDIPKLKANGMLRRSPSGTFKIVLKPKLTSYKGEIIDSPCMIGTKTGTIEVSKDYFMKMSQQQRIATLCHEYGHFYKNPIIKLPIGDEVGADLNGMTLFVGNGFSISEYANAFKTVFDKVPTRQNEQRAKLIKGFGDKVYNGYYFGKPYNIR